MTADHISKYYNKLGLNWAKLSSNRDWASLEESLIYICIFFFGGGGTGIVRVKLANSTFGTKLDKKEPWLNLR